VGNDLGWAAKFRGNASDRRRLKAITRNHIDGDFRNPSSALVVIYRQHAEL
jgi:hypothetical protein